MEKETTEEKRNEMKETGSMKLDFKYNGRGCGSRTIYCRDDCFY